MEVLSSLVQEELEELIGSILVPVGLGLTSDLSEETVELILGEELWNIS
jgi:hypothetical protein